MENTTTDFLAGKKPEEERQGEVYAGIQTSGKRKFYIESYGCAMNFSDSEIVAGILNKEGFSAALSFMDADLILINTCSIRENAEQRVRQRLTEFKKAKDIRPEALIGVLGCMAERLKSKFLEEEKIVDLVVGPDAYRSLPSLVASADDGQKGVNVLLSREETYSDISPVRLNSNGVTAFISIMRGCDNMCSFCVVPFTRGRERSRDYHSIVKEATELFNAGYREVTLLGQNVDSYKWSSPSKSPRGGDLHNTPDGEKMRAKENDEIVPDYKTANPVHYEFLKENAKKIRNNQTEAEQIVWAHIRNEQLETKFRRQHIVGNFIADFISLDLNLVIEIDGGIHKQTIEEDKVRDRWFQRKGFKTLRFSNEQVISNIDSVIVEIKREVEIRKEIKNINKETYEGQSNTLETSGKVLPYGEDLGGAVTFAQLLEKVALVNPLLRVRFSTSHPKDITDEVLYAIKKHPNICKYIHLPIQSGSSRILEKMNRTYTREWYINKIDIIRKIIPGCGISTDTISGFCSETEEDHAETLSIMDSVKFDMAYMFKYSERPGTLAAKKYADDVTEEVKSRRLSDIIDKQMGHQLEVNKIDIGKVYEVLVEGVSRRSDKDLFGRSTQNKVIVFPRGNHKIGEYVNVLVQKASAATLMGEVVETYTV